MSYKEFKAKYTRIQNLSKIEDPKPWLEYPPLIEEMLEVIICQEEALKGYRGVKSFKVGTIYWWTKEPNDIYIGEEDIVKDNETFNVSLLSSNKLTLSQVKYLSKFMGSDIDTNSYDYFFESNK